MEDAKTTEKAIISLKKSIDTLILLEFCKLGAGSKEIRSVLGSLDNNQFSAINAAIKGGKQHG